MKNIIKTIDYYQLKKNAQLIRIMSKTSKICAVVKSDAYGHGMTKIAKTIEPYVDYYGVIDEIEAIKLKKHVRLPIIILGENSSLGRAINAEIEIGVSHLNQLLKIEKAAKHAKKTAKIHIALDTGMHRLGTCDSEELNEMRKHIHNSRWLKLEGIYSHLGNGQDRNRTTYQVETFKKLATIFPSTTKHLFNTKFYLQNDFLDMIRVGAGLYGYDLPYVAPVKNVKARIIDIKKVNSGEYIGYGNNKAKQDMKIAIIAAGYNDGIPYLWKRGYVLYKDKKCPFVADICMNMSIIQAKDEMKPNEYVTLLGRCEKKSILASEIAQKCNTITNEILLHF